MKMIFETNDYQVIFAQNGKNGLTMFFSHNPDLVILDLGLPDMDGVDVIREIRAKSDTPIVVLSARTDESDKVEALDLGVNDYVTKPFGTAVFRVQVKACGNLFLCMIWRSNMMPEKFRSREKRSN